MKRNGGLRMKILALEFSSPQRSVAVVSVARRDELHESPSPHISEQNGTRVTRPSEVSAFEVVEAATGHTMKPFGMIEAALKQAGLEREQIECLAVGLGPGSYNGIRVAIALAQGWELATSVKLLGVSSAECVAAQALADGLTGKANVVFDAQRGEFYLAGYELVAGSWREVSPLKLTTLDDVQQRERAGEILVGPEVTRWFPAGLAVFPRAETLGKLACARNDFVSGDNLEPIYLRQTNFV